MNRIDGNQLSQLQSQQKKAEHAQKGAISSPTAQPTATNAKEAPTSDSVEISAAGRQLQELEKSMDTQAFNEQRVSLIKQAVDDGTYKPDPMSIAQKMVEMDSLTS